MRFGWMKVASAGFVAAALLVLLAPASLAQKISGDWPTYAGDLASRHFSQLTQINKQNVSKLAEAWSYKMGGRSPFEVTPIVVKGVMYFPMGKTVVALDPENGKEIWRYDFEGAQASTRGVSYWPGDKHNAPRIIFTTFDRRMIALDASTGKLVPSFGKDGVVTMDVGYTGVPTIFKTFVMVGASVGELPVGPPGDTRAFDALTGKLIWTFHTVAQPGEVGHDSWLNDGWKGRSGTNVWGWYMTVDTKRGLVYMPIGGPSPNYYGGDRPGANLFGNSIVAADVKTGKMKWYFQAVHHALWDEDLPPGPSLLDLNVNGKKVPALAAIGKSALMFILNRENGKSVFGVEERPVPKGDVPGEWYSPTQPFPVKPPVLARNTFKTEDIVTADDTTPEHAKLCKDLYDRSGGFYNAGPFTAWLYHEEGAPPKSTIQFPGGTGGSNWGGTAVDPKSNYVFVQTHDMSLVGWIEKKKAGGNYGRGTEGSSQIYDRASVDGPGPYAGFAVTMKDKDGKVIGQWPCQKPPWGRLSAVNANTGDIAWQVPLGITEGLPEGKQNTGSGDSAGPMATAGGLVFIGASSDKRFRAYDSATGKELWVAKLAREANANPLSYQAKNGKQYVAVVASDTLFVFALP